MGSDVGSVGVGGSALHSLHLLSEAGTHVMLPYPLFESILPLSRMLFADLLLMWALDMALPLLRCC